MSGALPWWAVLGYFVWSDLRRPSVSELASHEVTLLRSEVETLRKVLEEAGRDTLELERVKWWLDLIVKLLLLSWVFLVIVICLGSSLIRKRVAPRQSELPQPSLPSAPLPVSPPSTALSTPTSSTTRSGPLRPSGLQGKNRPQDGGPDLGRSRCASLGTLSS